MKTRLLLGLAVMMLSLNACAVQQVNMTVYVHEESGNPVEDVRVQGSFYQDRVVNKQLLDSHQGITDKNGIVELSGHEELYVDLTIKKKGYYNSKKRVVVRGKKGHDVSVLLRPKKNPIAMYVKKAVLGVSGTRKIDEQFGYDFMVGDFVSPYGKGIVSDLLITHTGNRQDIWNYTHKIIIQFLNPSDGLIPFFIDEKFKESDFKSAYQAPNNNYQNKWELSESRNGIGKPIKGNRDESRNYFIRVRSKTDNEGNVEAAYYGKIYGEFPFSTYYLNPTLNDRNVEFDPRQNLLKNLKHLEKVGAP